MERRSPESAPFDRLYELIDIEDHDRVESPAGSTFEQIGVLAPTPTKLGHVAELVPSIPPQRLHDLHGYALVDEQPHPVRFYAAAATSCANDVASATVPGLTPG